MRIYAEKLAESLHKTLYPIYLVFGNEPLLLQEAKTAIEKTAQAQGFLENTDLARMPGSIGTRCMTVAKH